MIAATQLNSIFDSLRIKAKCVSENTIRNITTYDIELAPGGRVKDIIKYTDEISMALRAQERPVLRVCPNEGLVKLDVVTKGANKLSFFQEYSKHPRPDGVLPFLLGETIDGKAMWVDFAKNPHTLIAGTTGSGKSTLLHTIIANALYLSVTQNVTVFLSDPKTVEFPAYKKFDSFFVANSYEKTLEIIKFAIKAMDERYQYMSDNNLSTRLFEQPNDRFPHYLIIIDEFADLAMQDTSKELVTSLCKLAQKCRAAGIHIVLATQRPSVDVISGIIKTNFPARIACKVSSHIDSKVILDTSGAELLAGHGDALIRNHNNNLKRFQVMYTDQDEVCSMFENLKWN